MEETLSDNTIKIHEPVRSFPQLQRNVPMPVRISEPDAGHVASFSTDSGPQSFAPLNERLSEAKNERRYRYLLEHDFNPSCKQDALLSISDPVLKIFQ